MTEIPCAGPFRQCPNIESTHFTAMNSQNIEHIRQGLCPRGDLWDSSGKVAEYN